MGVKRQQWNYIGGEKVWVGRYRNSHNLPHWHYDCELIYVESGGLNIFCNQNAYSVTAGQSLFIDSEQVHYMHALTPQTTLSMIIFSYDIIQRFTDGKTLASPVLSDDYGLNNAAKEIMSELKARKPLYDVKAETMVISLIVDIFRNEKLAERKKSGRTLERFKGLLTEMDEKYEFYDLETASDFMGMNAAYFSRLFHKLTNITFTEYLNYIKVKNAVALLKNGDMAVTEIAAKSGFNTIRNFNRIFKEYTGYSPKDLPKQFTLKESLTGLDELSTNPTLGECVLLESSDGNGGVYVT